MAVSKKIRFEVFKRDLFQCQYCGKTPPDVSLEVDHIMPKSKDGKDDITNLITSCFDCNRGKSDTVLEKLPNTIIQNYEILKEKELQLAEYNKLVKKINKRINNEANKISLIFSESFDGYEFSDKFINTTIKMFLKKLPYDKVEFAMYKACSIMTDSRYVDKYFCGICWNMVKNGTDNERV